ncbi:hypothetical protein N7457_003129, partial [Penicillium paradoxum]
TYDHRVWKTGLPVRSAVLKPHAGELVVGWVTTSESSLFTHSTHNMILASVASNTYDHRVWKIGLPVRSAVLKPHAGELVVGWVTTSESSLLYVFVFSIVFTCSETPSCRPTLQSIHLSALNIGCYSPSQTERVTKPKALSC